MKSGAELFSRCSLEGGDDFSGNCFFNELDQNHGGIIAVAIAELDDAGVTARTVGVTFCDIIEEFFEDGVVILGIFSIRAIDGALIKAGGNDAASVDIIAFCTFSDRDKLIDDGTKFFSFGLCGHNGFVIEKLCSEVLEHGTAMSGRAAKMTTRFTMSHNDFLTIYV